MCRSVYVYVGVYVCRSVCVCRYGGVWGCVCINVFGPIGYSEYIQFQSK